MLYHFFKIIVRQFVSSKMYMLIKVFGLAIGLAVSLLIMLFILHELSYDSFHKHRDSIYNMVITSQSGDVVETTAMSTAAMGVSLLEEFPEIEDMVRFSYPSDVFFVIGGKTRQLKDVVFADSSVLDVFSFPLVSGNPKYALTEPFTMVLTESGAKQLFGNENPVGKVLDYNGKYNFRITGVVEDPPANSHLYFGALMSFTSLYSMEGNYLDWDGGWSYYTYVKVAKNMNWQLFNSKIRPFMEKHINAKYRNFGVELRMHFDPLMKVYLNSSAPGDHPRSGNPGNLWLFAAIAVFILFIACINFINLSTARYTSRSREVGVRKVLGADRKRLILHFLGESMVLSFMALLLALFFAELLIPEFNDLTQTTISLFKTTPLIIPTLLVLGILVGLLAGSYPAFFMLSFKPISVIKGNMISANKGKGLRNLLVVSQFIISAVLMIATITIYMQLRYVNNKQPGFIKNNILVLQLEGEKSKISTEILKTELLKLPFVQSAGASSEVPGFGFTRNGYFPEGYDNAQLIHVLDVDDTYLETMDIKIVLGEGFSKESALDDNAFLVNRALAENLSWQNPIGKTISRDGQHTIIGMVEDFHFAPMNLAVAPLIITRKPYSGFENLSIRLKPGNNPGAIDAIEKIWIQLFPSEPFNYFFLDNSMKMAYTSEQKFGQFFIAFSLLAVLLACLGLFGLASFLAERHRKEIGVRKTFGASSLSILLWLGKDFTVLVLAGNLIAWPLAWFAMHRWLNNFAYKIPLYWWIFAVALAFSLFITFSTVAWQSLKASRQNPVDSLRYE